MSCGWTAELTAYLDEELSESKRQAVEAHLPGCAECGPTLALLQRGTEPLGDVTPFVPSPALRRAVLRGLEEPRRGLLSRLALLRPSLLIPAMGMAAAAALAVLLTPGSLPLDTSDAGMLQLAAHLELVEDLDILGLEGPADLEAVIRLHELEALP